MSACTRYPDDEVVLRYVTSDLAEPELAAFEDHMFACDACLARVERYQMAQRSLAVRELPAPPTVVGGTAHRDAALPRPSRWWALGAIAAMLIVGLAGLSMWTRRPAADAVLVAAQPVPTAPNSTAAPATPASGPSTSSLRVAVLAMVTPPPYLSLTTRAAEESSFSDAMQAYSRADWPAASRGLARLDAADARFYKGIADLMRGDTAAAVEALQSARASGRQPYARESVFYLAKAALQRGDVASAHALLVEARDVKAGPDREAARLLTELSEIRQ